MAASASAGFGVFFDPTKTTSGQRFFENLSTALRGEARPLSERPRTVLFNVSAPLKTLIAAKLARQRIVLRIDGLYFDRLSPVFIAKFAWPLRAVFALGLKYPRAHDFLAFWANLLNQNYGAFARILLADHVIYQSRFSQIAHERYFARKPYDIIVNGAFFRDDSRPGPRSENDLRLVTIYDEWKPAKRVQELVEFVRWARELRSVPLTLTILGYTGSLPATAPPHVRAIIERSSYVRSVPRFKTFDGEVSEALLAADAYLTFTYRDPCPNAVVEAMAHGLPVVGVASGGVPDIVGDAGVLLAADDFADGFFCDHRFGSKFPLVDFDLALDAVRSTISDATEYRARVRRRFADDLELKIVAQRYAMVLRRVASRT